MSHKAETAHNIEKKLKAFAEACRNNGLKLTHQRMEIYRELARALDHPTVETLYKRLRPAMPSLSLDTVYRTLTTFEKNGLVIRVETLDNQARFEAETKTHHHIFCKICGMITDFRWQNFDRKKLPPKISQWGTIEKKNVLLHGICHNCLAGDQESDKF